MSTTPTTWMETPITDEAKHQTFVTQLNRHASILRKVAHTYARSASDRRDLMQDITLQLWRAYPRYDASRSFSTWMYRIALNVGISFLRGAGNPSRQPVSFDELGFEPSISTEGQEDVASQLRLLQRFIERLDPLDRALLILYLDERSHREIAEVLGISVSNVGTKIGRLKRKVRDELTEPSQEG